MTPCSLPPRSQQKIATGERRLTPELWQGDVAIRAMTVKDQDLLRSFFQNLSPSARYRRFMSPMRNVADSIIQHLSAVDQNNHVAYLAETWQDGAPIMIAEARYVLGQKSQYDCEFAIAVADQWQGRGIGHKLLSRLERQAAQSGRHELTADTLPENSAMIGLAKRCGFSVARQQHDFKVKRLTKTINLH